MADRSLHVYQYLPKDPSFCIQNLLPCTIRPHVEAITDNLPSPGSLLQETDCRLLLSLPLNSFRCSFQDYKELVVMIKLCFWVSCVAAQLLLCCIISGQSWCPLTSITSTDFHQKTNRFWEYEERTRSWVEVTMPFDLMSCINESCTRVGSIQSIGKKQNQQQNIRTDSHVVEEENYDTALPLRKRISLTKVSESSVWVTGQSGSIYERFWNGVQWVIAPHELPTLAGQAVSVFIVNQTILALSEAGMVYQLQLNENSQPIWTEFMLMLEPSMHKEQTEPRPTMKIKSGVVSHDGERLYFSTTNGMLLEINEFQPLRWENHSRPPGGDVSAIADTGSIRPGVAFIVSTTGDLYEFDKKSKPAWKKHIWSEASSENISLAPCAGYTLHGLVGAHSLSLFLLTKSDACTKGSGSGLFMELPRVIT